MFTNRKEALAAGATHFFTGRPCKRGHTAQRYVSTGSCTECLASVRQTYAKTRPVGFVLPAQVLPTQEVLNEILMYIDLKCAAAGMPLAVREVAPPQARAARVTDPLTPFERLLTGAARNVPRWASVHEAQHMRIPETYGAGRSRDTYPGDWDDNVVYDLEHREEKKKDDEEPEDPNVIRGGPYKGEKFTTAPAPSRATALHPSFRMPGDEA